MLTRSNELVNAMLAPAHERILDAAVACFGRHGYRKASIEVIAEHAKVGKGSVYLHCKDKEDLFYQAVHRELRTWTGEMSKLIDHRVPADELMYQIAVADLHFVEKRPLVQRALMGLLQADLPGWAAEFDELRAIGRRHVEELIRLGIKQKVFASDLDVEATAQVLQDMHYAGRVLVTRTHQELAEVRRHQMAAMRLVMKGLQSR